VFRYAAIIWNRDDHAQTAFSQSIASQLQRQSTPWQIAVHLPGLLVFYADAAAYVMPHVLSNNRGVILGILFRKQGPAAGCVVLSEAEIERVSTTQGRALIDDFWGNYVAILADDRSFSVLRGPASALPCLHIRHDGVDLYFSWMEGCAQLELRRLTIDWLAFARTLVGPYTSQRTDIEGVQEILPGVCKRRTGDHYSEEVLWDPIALSRRSPIQDAYEAAHALRTVIRYCTHTWVSQHSRIVLSLSGGLDSSIILTCLADAPSRPDIVCINQYANECGDERSYARLACERAGTRLYEYFRSPRLDFTTAVYNVRIETSPGLRIPAVDRIDPDFARAAGATAVFRGDGGDEISCRNRTDLSLADFLRDRGLRRGAFGLAMHAATMEGRTSWGVLVQSLRDAWLPRRWNLASLLASDPEGGTLLHPDVLSALRDDSAALGARVLRTRDAPPGRLFQISLMCARRPYYGPFTRLGDPVTLAPLLSQPVIEVCLRIPTYFQMMGRRDRALSRQAFAGDLPPEITQRRDKGDAEPLARDTLVRNLDYVREMLLGGIVAQQGIVDLRRLEAALSSAPSTDAVPSVPLYDLLGAEIWARAWRF
jgi:asparagine synthase (glutamine-hydrolysing)